MNKIARLKISVVIIISFYIGWITTALLNDSWRGSSSWNTSSELERSIVVFLINVVMLPLLMFFAYTLFCTVHAILYPFVSRYAYFLYSAGYRYGLVKGRSGMSAWFWVKNYGKWTIKVGHHGHMADRNLKFRNKVTFFITGIDISEEDLVKLNLNELVNNIYNCSRVYSIDPKGGSVLLSIDDYFDTSDYKQSLKAAEFVLNTVKEYSNKRSQ